MELPALDPDSATYSQERAAYETFESVIPLPATIQTGLEPGGHTVVGVRDIDCWFEAFGNEQFIRLTDDAELEAGQVDEMGGTLTLDGGIARVGGEDDNST